jgi:uncharacterized repeat protein (TIGR01451 family)
MKSGIQKLVGVVALIACAASAQANAQAPLVPAEGCIVLKSTAEIEQVEVNEKGEKTTKLVPAGKVVPGTEVVWTITANNICKKPAENAVITNAVPEHMTYVADSATGPGSDIRYSLDGETFAADGQLTVVDSGVTRKARADEYKHIRWQFRDALQPGASASARFRTVLN